MLQNLVVVIMAMPYKIQLAKIHHSLALIVLVGGISTKVTPKNEQIFTITADVLKNNDKDQTDEQIRHSKNTV